MDTINILTGQNIAIKYEPASIVQRMLALLLDYIFMSAYILIMYFILFSGLDNIYDTNIVLFFVLCLLFLPVLCYHVIFETLMSGQTPGKLILRIRVTNIDGSAPNFVSYFLRWILLIIDIIPNGGVGALLIIFTKNHQRLGDLAAGTTVVKNISTNYNIENVFNEFTDSYTPVFPRAVDLTDGQIRLISELLENPANNVAIKQLALKIRTKLNIETKLNDRDFLKSIVKDYNHYSTVTF